MIFSYISMTGTGTFSQKTAGARFLLKKLSETGRMRYPAIRIAYTSLFAVFGWTFLH